jgi:hypothetical protein
VSIDRGSASPLPSRACPRHCVLSRLRFFITHSTSVGHMAYIFFYTYVIIFHMHMTGSAVLGFLTAISFMGFICYLLGSYSPLSLDLSVNKLRASKAEV